MGKGVCVCNMRQYDSLPFVPIPLLLRLILNLRPLKNLGGLDLGLKGQWVTLLPYYF